MDCTRRPLHRVHWCGSRSLSITIPIPAQPGQGSAQPEPPQCGQLGSGTLPSTWPTQQQITQLPFFAVHVGPLRSSLRVALRWPL
jgi:hypothetical protein